MSCSFSLHSIVLHLNNFTHTHRRRSHHHSDLNHIHNSSNNVHIYNIHTRFTRMDSDLSAPPKMPRSTSSCVNIYIYIFGYVYYITCHQQIEKHSRANLFSTTRAFKYTSICMPHMLLGRRFGTTYGDEICPKNLHQHTTTQQKDNSIGRPHAHL